MNCLNCKKDLVPGTRCEPCDAILNTKLTEVLSEPIVLPEVEPVKTKKKVIEKVTKKKK